jgi:hypothetical protein
MSEPIVFISHLIEEKEIALGLREFVSTTFGGRVSVAISADYEAAAATREWLVEARNAIETCKYAIVLCSPESVRRMATAFEAGAAWMKGAAVVALCHGGVEPGRLPPPLGFLKAGNLFDPHRITAVVEEIAKAAGVEAPRLDAAAFVERLQRAGGAAPKLEIISATYGVGKERFDVTIPVRRNLTKQGLQLLASNATLGTSGKSGEKELTIRYAINGVEETLVVKEGEIAMIRLRQ